MGNTDDLQYLGMKTEPFADNVISKDSFSLRLLPKLLSVMARLATYVLSIGGLPVVTGDVGTGQSTVVRRFAWPASAQVRG